MNTTQGGQSPDTVPALCIHSAADSEHHSTLAGLEKSSASIHCSDLSAGPCSQSPAHFLEAVTPEQGLAKGLQN